MRTKERSATSFTGVSIDLFWGQMEYGEEQKGKLVFECRATVGIPKQAQINVFADSVAGHIWVSESAHIALELRYRC